MVSADAETQGGDHDVRFHLITIVVAPLSIFPVAAEAQTPTDRLDALVKAYPAFLVRHDGTSLYWTDGSRTPVSDGRATKTYDERLRTASILDQLSQPYPKGPQARPPAKDEDPGRFRNTAFFDKMYGDCFKQQTQGKLVTIRWVPKFGGGTLKVSSVNGVAEHLQAVSDELERKPQLKPYLVPSAGTFNCRVVKDTGQRSMHAWGVAIDINVKYSNYWLWGGGKYVNRIPYEIVEMFERHGFIWGGKWSHFDTMHFEYRPELL